jgi:hypothetical protein
MANFDFKTKFGLCLTLCNPLVQYFLVFVFSHQHNHRCGCDEDTTYHSPPEGFGGQRARLVVD